MGLQGKKQSAQLWDTRVPWDESPRHGHGSPQLPSGGRDGSAAGGKFQKQILSCCFSSLTGRECCSLVCFPHIQERQNGALKSLDTSHEPLVSLKPSLSSQLPGFLQDLLETRTKRSASLSLGFFHVLFQDALCLLWKCSLAIPAASWSQQGQIPQIQGHGRLAESIGNSNSQDGKMGLEESQV